MDVICLVKSFFILQTAQTFVNSQGLQLVHVLMRHGDRTPTHLYPNDNNTVDTWPQGLSQLTKLGVQQEYKFGQYLRKRYITDINYLSPSYQRVEINMRSTDRDRTLMSSTSLLQGMYPDTVGTVPWYPIPVHTRPENDDPMLNMDINCERYNQGFQKYAVNSPEGEELVKNNKDFMGYVCKKAGWNSTTLWNVWNTYDALSIEISHNRTVPDWVTPEIFDKIEMFFEKKFKFYYYTQDLQKMKGGLFMTEVYNNTHDKVSGRLGKDMKAFLYMAHDTTLAAVLASLGVWDGFVPPLVSALFIEQYLMPDGEHTIRLLYKNDSLSNPEGEPLILILPGCKELCPVESFYKLVEPVMMQDVDAWFLYCEQWSGRNITKGGIVAVTIFSGLFLIGLIILFIWCYRHHQQEVRYRPANFGGDPTE